MRLIDRAVSACADHETVVVVSAALAPVVAPATRRIIVVNDAPERGMNRSLQLALANVPPTAGCIVLLADMPYVDAELVERVAAAATHAEVDVCYPTFAGSPAHPVYFGPKARPFLDALPDGDGLRSVRDAFELRRRSIFIDDVAITADVDTRDALDALGGSLSSSS